MVLSAAIGYGSGLPAWMFHCQVPPPDYVFHPEVRGISWVDLVFPFFIFSLGAAIPFSLGSRIDRGESLWKVVLGVVRRGVVLLLFSVVVGNADSSFSASPAPEWVCGVFRLGVWLALFAALVRSRHGWINYAGWAVVAGLMLVQHFALGVPVKFSNNDCILKLLSIVAVTAGLVWILTRSSHRMRAGVWMLLVAAKLLGWDFLQYSIIAVPATMVGDIIRRSLSSGSASPALEGPRAAAAAVIALATVVLQLWGFYTRNILLDGVLTAGLAAAFVLLTFRSRTMFSNFGYAAFALLLMGIVFDPIDGGIAKDYCNMSYLLASGGMALLTLCFLLWRETLGPLSRNFLMTGRNPMIAYTVTWFVLEPLLYAVGIEDWVDDICVGSPVLGIVRGLVLVLLTMAATNLCTRFRLFWRS